jgi:hypothetical protein
MSKQPFNIKVLSPNMVEVTLDDNVYLDISVTDMIDQELHKIGPDRKFYQLVIANGPYIVNPEMRNSFSKSDTGNKLLGIAWISPDEDANKEQEEIVSKLTLPAPIRFFSDREKGLKWLKQLDSPQ